MYSIYLKCIEYTYFMYKSCFLCKYCILKLYFPGFDGIINKILNEKNFTTFFLELVAKKFWITTSNNLLHFTVLFLRIYTEGFFSYNYCT